MAGTLPAPKGFTVFGTCVPQMGTHYGREGEWPFGPVLGYDQQGRLVFVEYMITQEDFTGGLSWENLPGFAGKTINHVDVTFMPNGHPGHEMPHDDIQLYFVSANEKAEICPGGETATTGETVLRYPRR